MTTLSNKHIKPLSNFRIENDGHSITFDVDGTLGGALSWTEVERIYFRMKAQRPETIEAMMKACNENVLNCQRLNQTKEKEKQL